MGTEASGKQEVMKRGYSDKTSGRDGCLKSFIVRRWQNLSGIWCKPKSAQHAELSSMGAGNNYKLLNDKRVTNLKINEPYRIERLVMALFIMC